MRGTQAALGAVSLALAVTAGAVVGLNVAPDTKPVGSVHVAVAEPSASRVVVSAPDPVPAARVKAAEVTRPDPPKPPPVHPTSYLAADAIVPAVALYTIYGTPYEGGRVMTNPTQYDLPLVFRVIERYGEWLKVQISSRPNGVQVMIRASDVRLRRVPNWIKVELGSRKVTVFHGETPIFQTTGTIGKSGSPTPTGTFFVDASVLLTDPNGPYGVGQLALSGFSDVYQSFGGGEGQIALHGTNAPGLIGQAASHGCVRLVNADFLKIMDMAPLGTPVEIVN